MIENDEPMIWDNNGRDPTCDWCRGMSGWPHPGPHMKGGAALAAREREDEEMRRQIAVSSIRKEPPPRK